MTTTPCLTCAALITIQPLPHPPPFQHGCCDRYVCFTCITTRPRLATFCPFCDDAHAALRKGRRHDVCFQGDVLFDVDSAEKARQLEDEAMGGQGSPPPYASNDDFRIDDGEEGDEHGDARDSIPTPTTSLPRLMASSSSKSMAQHPELVSDRARSHSSDDMASSIPAAHAHREGSSSAASALLAVAQSSAATAQTQAQTQTQAASSVRHRSPASSSRHSVRTRTPPPEADATTVQYWLRPYDTVQGLSLKFGISAHQLCQLNALSTPHLLHTRPFILLPTSSLPSSDTELASALAGPPPSSPAARTRAARRATEARFRALVMRSMRSAGPDVMRPDERAARTYVALVEDELHWLEFRDEKKGDADAVPAARGDEDADGDDDAARNRRFEAVLKLAVARWEMDSEWERLQRINGVDLAAPHAHASSSTSTAPWRSGATPYSSSAAASQHTMFPLPLPGPWRGLFGKA